ncbi:MFS transporter [Streptomyces sp. NBC_00287]
MVGPALAGLLVAAFDERVVLFADAATFAVLALALLLLGVRREPVPAGAKTRWLSQVRQGVGVLSRDRLLRTAILALASAIVFTAVLSVARVFFIREDLNASDAGYGVLVTAHTVGMLLAAALIASRIPLYWQPRVLAGAGGLMGMALFVSASVPVFAVALVGFVLTGVANSLQGLAIRNLIHARVPVDVRGRAFDSSGAALNGANLAGTALGGPVSSLLGGAVALQVAGAGTVAASLMASPVLLRGSALASAPQSPGPPQSIEPARD